jgi:hypothetical protein
LRGRNGFQNTLFDLDNKQSLDSLIKEAWSPEGAALSSSGMHRILAR